MPQFDNPTESYPKGRRVVTPQLEMVIGRVMSDINNKKMTKGASFGQQYILQKGLNKFGDHRSKASTKEMNQLHQRKCSTPIDISELTPQEKRKSTEALKFLNEKCDKYIKGQMVYNRKTNPIMVTKRIFCKPNISIGEYNYDCNC